MKKTLCYILVMCLLLTTLSLFSGCTLLEKFKEDIEWIEEISDVPEMDNEVIFTSYLGNETLTISRNHESFLGVHCTVYYITIEEDGKQTYYYKSPATTPCEGVIAPIGCNGKLASLESGAELGGAYIKEIYPYVEDIRGYLTIQQLQSKNMSLNQFKSHFVDNVFNQVLNNQYDDMVSQLNGSAISTITNVNDYVSKIYNLQNKLEEAANLYLETKGKDLGALAYTYMPILETLVDGFNDLTDVIDTSNPFTNADSLTAKGHEALKWKHLKNLSELSPSGKQVEFQKTDTHIQYRCAGDSDWKNLESLENLSPDGRNVIFQVTNTEIQWRCWTDNEILLYAAQAALHEKVKGFADKV